ncbi:MAG: hypothetical protein SFX73_13785 [Kofleriaceae bacterium]|nr:hypothetical protein [Kofleriaceae bacterium]
MRIALLLVGGFAAACARAGGEGTVDAQEGTADAPPNGRMVTVSLRGPGSGSVTSTPSGIACPGDCEEPVTVGQTVTLTAQAGASSAFTGWSGAGCSGTGPCTFTANGPVEVSANFEESSQVPLSVGKLGNGSGSVTSSPGGIVCGATCAFGFDEGTVVTLMATPALGTSFTGWSGGGCSGTGSCVVTLTAPTSVNATFTLAQYALTVTKAGSGTVTSNPSGISCGADCTESYAHGTSVTLTATPNASGTFTGWSGGGCSGTGTCTVPMTAVTSVQASFSGPLTCSSVTNASSCTNGAISEINLGTISASSCRTQCQTQMGQKGMSSGCWLVALNNICYCRSGTLSTGGSNGNRPGGVCN